jgi:hypothetical protein
VTVEICRLSGASLSLVLTTAGEPSVQISVRAVLWLGAAVFSRWKKVLREKGRELYHSNVMGVKCRCTH